ncbi:MAG: GH25 family lysozyme [Candidatus Hodarchaeales archaeon]
MKKIGNIIILLVLGLLLGINLFNTTPTITRSTKLVSRSGNWVEQGKLIAKDGVTRDMFGISVSVSGDIAVIGAHMDDDSGIDSGSAYVFVRNGNSWTKEAKLIANDGEDWDGFGISVSISNDTAVIGAWFDDNKTGSAYVFVRKGNIWIKEAKLVARDRAEGDRFGASVSISGDTIVIGAYTDDDAGSSSGSAYVFVRSGTIWTQQAKLTASDATEGDFFGISVSNSENSTVIGACYDDVSGTDSGSAYVFSCNGTKWIQQAKLIANDSYEGDLFGNSVSIYGDSIAIGADLDDDGGSDSGSVYVFVYNGTTWSQQAKLIASDAEEEDAFGVSVSINVDTVMVGAWQDDDAGTDSGSVYVFEWNGTIWNQETKLKGANGEHYGFSVSFDGSTAVIGAPYDDHKGTLSGSAYVYGLETIPSSEPIKGIDVSHWNVNTNKWSGITFENWTDIKDAGYTFAFCKATQDTETAPSYLDKTFATNIEEGRKAGMLMGAYHFATPYVNDSLLRYGPNDAKAEALHFVNIAREYLRVGDLRPVLDIENYGLRYWEDGEEKTKYFFPGEELSKFELSDWIHEWMDTIINELGIEPILYVSSDYANNPNYLDSSVTKYDLWIAHYTEDPSMLPDHGMWDDWNFWQYSERGTVPGIEGEENVDLDLFNGNKSNMWRFLIPVTYIDEFPSFIPFGSFLMINFLFAAMKTRKRSGTELRS